MESDQSSTRDAIVGVSRQFILEVDNTEVTLGEEEKVLERLANVLMEEFHFSCVTTEQEIAFF